MKFKERTNKIISFVLAIATVISTLSPAFTSIVEAGVIYNTVEPQTEYSDSGFLPEEVVTGTDFDNFSISLKYGYINNSYGDTLHLTDAEVQVPITINIEYRGDQSYEAGAISFTMNDVETLTRNPENRNKKDRLNNRIYISYDIGAELVGSGSGRGDWYYTVTESADKSENNIYTFTNKNKIDTSFTSSIEFVMSLKDATEFISGFEDNILSTLTIGENSKSSNQLSFKYSTTPDTYKHTKIINSQYLYTTYSTDTSTYEVNGYKLDDYYVMYAVVFMDEYKNNRTFGYNCSFDPESYGQVTLTTNEGVIIEDCGGNTLTTTVKNAPHTVSEGSKILLFIPKDTYDIGDTIDLTATFEGVYYDEHEPFKDSITSQVQVIDTKILVYSYSDYLTGSKRFTPISSAYLYNIVKNNGVDVTMNLGPFGIYNSDEIAVVPEPTKTIIEDSYFGFSSWSGLTTSNGITTIKDRVAPTLDEYYLTKVTFLSIPADCTSTADIYVLPYGQTEYELFGTYNIIAETDTTEMNINLNRTDIQSVKFEINGSYKPYIQLSAHLNPSENYSRELSYDFYFINTCNVIQETEDGRVFEENFLWDDFVIKAPYVDTLVTTSTSNYTVKDQQIIFPISVLGDVVIYNINDTDQVLELYETEISFTYPKIFSINPEKYRLKIGSDSSSTLKLFKNSEYQGYKTFNKDTLPAFLSVDYTIEDNGDSTNKITYKIKTDSEHPFLVNDISYSSRSVINIDISNNIYLDFDAYSGLKVQGKLPAAINSSLVFSADKETSNLKEFDWLKEFASKTKIYQVPSLAGNTYQGVEKFVNTGSGFSKELQAIGNNNNYSYKLRLSGGQTKVNNIVLYDNIEEAYGDNEYWKGTFNGIDTSLLDMYYEGEEYTYTVYYSADKAQAFDLTADGWVKAEDWTGLLSDVKSIAVDLGEFTLLPTSTVYVIINMISPETGSFGIKAYNSYAADYKAYDATTGIQMEDVKALPSNITEVLFATPVDIVVNKVWEGSDPVVDSITVGLLADNTEVSTVVLSEENNWSQTLHDIPTLNNDNSLINYTVKEKTILDRFEITYDSITSENTINFTITNTKLPFDVYKFEKEWTIEGQQEISLGLIEDPALSLEEQKTARAGNTFIITATGKDLETVSFEAMADTDGIITVPDNYKDYTHFYFALNYNSKIYNCNYEILFTDPAKPEEITINVSNGESFVIKAEDDWTASYLTEDLNLTFKEEPVENWNQSVDAETNYNGLAITFDQNTKLGSMLFNYVYIYYKYDGSIYRTGKYYNYLLKGETIEIPSTEFWISLYASSFGVNNYGFKIDSIENKEVSTVLGSTTTSLPTVESIETSGDIYPESLHNPTNTGTTVWHYTLQEKKPDNIEIDQIEAAFYNVKITNTGKQIASIVSADIEPPKIDFNINKEWTVIDTNSIILGYSADSDLTEADYKSILANKALNITATGEGLEDAAIEVTADENGNITIPDEYKSHTNFAFEVEYNNKVYQFNYKVSRTDPVKPASITIIPSVSGYDNEGNEITEITLTADNNWTTTVKFTDPTVTFTEKDVTGWSGEISVIQNGETYTVSIKNTGVYSYASTVNVDNREFTYNIEKEWKFNDVDFSIGYLADSGLTENEYKSIVAGKIVNITASGDGLNSTTFEATADENGNIVIPAQYGSYTTLTFQVISNNSAYNFTYNVSKSQPTIPDAIKLYSSDGSTIILKKSEGWTTEYVSEIMNLQFAEELGQTTGEILDALSSISNDYGISLANDIIIDDDVIIEGGDVIIGGETVTLVDYTIKNYLSGALISSVDYSTDTTNTTYATIFAEIENNLATFATQNDCKLISYTVKNASGVVVNSTDTISSGKLTVEANYEPNTGLGGSAVMIFYDGDLQGSFDTTRSDYSELFEHLEEEAQKFAQQEGAIYDGILVTDLDGKEIKSTDPITDLDVLVYVNLLIGPEIGVEQFTVRISISGENVSDNFTVDTQEKYYELPFQMIENRIQDKGYDQDPYYTGYKVIDSMTGKEAKPSDNITGGTLQVQLQYSNPLEDFESEVSVEKVDDYNYNVKVVNTGKYIYTTTSTVNVGDVNKDITITKEWIIPEDFIKLNIKDTLGYEGDYEKVEILNKADTVLETIVKPDEAGLLVSANKYTITETYTAKIYMADGTIKTATINENKFELVPVEIELFDGETSLGVFELNEENNWQVTVSVPATAELTIKEITTGNWTYEVNDTVITNTVNQEIEITDITVPVPGEIIDTGNEALPTYVLVIFFTGLAGLATSLLLSRKKKNR